jgi:CheY-like chemotaxis protein
MNSLVLIAEEDPALTDLLGRTLESGDYRATVAADGEEALLCVEEGRPGVQISHRSAFPR